MTQPKSATKGRILVVMGGNSLEREISLQSGSEVMGALRSLGYQTQALDFDERFLDGIKEFAPDAVFIALHGPGGEDGHIQGLLEYLTIPYTGSGLEASALAMDKHLTKKLLAAEGLPTPVWDLFDLAGGTLPLLPGSLDLPLAIKPRYEGSSNGITIVRTHEAWTNAMLEASKSYAQILAEEYVTGREFTCAVLGEEALPIVEIVSNRDGYYSYDAKYEPGGSTHVAPAKIDEDLAARLQMLALSAHRLLGLRDYSRSDFIVTRDYRPYILEVNSLPGLTPRSLVPDACAAAGIGFEALIDRLVSYALGRGELRDAVA